VPSVLKRKSLKRNSLNRISLLHIVLLLLLISACKPKQKLSTSNLSLSNAELTEALQSSNVDYEWYGAEAKIRFETEYDGISGKLILRLKKDESIWLVAKKLGIEGVRVLITPDTLIALNRQERTYVKEPLERMLNKYNISLDFQQIQELLVGNLLVPEDLEVLKTEQDSNYHYLTTNLDELLIKYTIDNLSRNVSEIKISDSSNRTITGSYDDYRILENTNISPYIRNYTVPQTEYGTIHLDIKMNSIEFDVPQSMPFEIPSHYTRM